MDRNADPTSPTSVAAAGLYRWTVPLGVRRLSTGNSPTFDRPASKMMIQATDEVLGDACRPSRAQPRTHWANRARELQIKPPELQQHHEPTNRQRVLNNEGRSPFLCELLRVPVCTASTRGLRKQLMHHPPALLAKQAGNRGQIKNRGLSKTE